MDLFEKQLVALMPNMRAFARSLSNNLAQADDLVQETFLKALEHRHQFREGSNLRAWVFTILRNTQYSDLRKKKREVEDIEGVFASKVEVLGSQDAVRDLSDMREAFSHLSHDHAQALITVASGYSYNEAVDICHCAIGTVKSRVNRARVRLTQLLDPEPEVETPQVTVL